MEKLSRLLLLQLKTILKGFFPKYYVKIKKSRRVIIKKHFFSLKPVIDTNLTELLNSIIPKYLSSVKSNDTKDVGQHLKEINSLVNEKAVVNYLHKEYISLSQYITKEFTNSIVKDLKQVEFKLKSEPIDFLSFLKKKKDPQQEKIKELQQLPSAKVKSMYTDLIKEKQDLLVKHGKITVLPKESGRAVEFSKFKESSAKIHSGKTVTKVTARTLSL
jgi:hypothetical protein